MTTLAIGNLVEGSRGRIWRLDSSYTRDGYTRWVMTVINNGTGDTGDQTSASETWLQRYCVDYAEPTVDPPCGTGTNRACVLHGSEMVDSGLFGNATDMLEWLTRKMTDDLHGKWFGWNGDVVLDPPDMTVAMVDGELIWADAQ